MEFLFPLFLIVPFALVGAMFGVWIWALVDALQVPADIFYRAGSKILWGILIGVMGPLAAVIYFAVGRPDRAMREWMDQQRAAGVDLRAYRVYDQPGLGGGGWPQGGAWPQGGVWPQGGGWPQGGAAPYGHSSPPGNPPPGDPAPGRGDGPDHGGHPPAPPSARGYPPPPPPPAPPSP